MPIQISSMQYELFFAIGFAEGKYVRRFLPVLSKMPAKYIYEPWKAPLDVQQRAGCVVGKDYPKPIVDHAVASKACIARMKAAYDSAK